MILALDVLPREATMLARSWDRNSVRLSVRPSVTRVPCKSLVAKILNVSSTAQMEQDVTRALQ